MYTNCQHHIQTPKTPQRDHDPTTRPILATKQPQDILHHQESCSQNHQQIVNNHPEIIQKSS